MATLLTFLISNWLRPPMETGLSESGMHSQNGSSRLGTNTFLMQTLLLQIWYQWPIIPYLEHIVDSIFETLNKKQFAGASNIWHFIDMKTSKCHRIWRESISIKQLCGGFERLYLGEFHPLKNALWGGERGGGEVKGEKEEEEDREGIWREMRS